MMIEDKDKKKKAINNINNNGQTDIKAYFFWISLIIFMCISGIFYVIKNRNLFLYIIYTHTHTQ